MRVPEENTASEFIRSYFQDTKFIHTLFTKLLPSNRSCLYSFDNLRQNESLSREHGAQGLYVVRDPSNPGDRNGWLVIHFPTLVRYVSRRPMLPVAYSRPEYTAQASTLLNTDTELRYALERSWRQHVLTEWLPPGSNVWSDSSAFHALLSPILEHLRDELGEDITDLNSDEWIVARPGQLMSWGKSASGLFEAFRSFRNLPIHGISSVGTGVPSYFTLLLFALSRSRTTGKGYEDWGIAWLDEGLYFNHYRAFMTAKKDLALSEMFPGDTFEDYLGPWSSPAYFERYPKWSALPRLSVVSQPAEDLGARLSAMLAPYGRINGEGARHGWNAEHARIFNIDPRKNDTLVRYLRDFNEIATAAQSAKPAVKFGERSKHFLTRRNPGVAPVIEDQHLKVARLARQRDYTVFSVNAMELGWFDKTSPLVMGISETHGTYYMSPPTEFLECFPELMDGALFERAGIKDPTKPVETSTYKYNVSLIRRLKLGKRIPYCMMAHNMNYLHPLMFDPVEGEFWQMLRMITGTYRDVRGQTYAPLIKAFESFCQWLFNPHLFEKTQENPEFFVGNELQYLIDPNSGCPVNTPTLHDRLSFFWDKATKLREKLVAFDDSPTTPGARRAYSPQTGPYDKWCLWYVATHELPQLDVRLTDAQQCEYIAKRWLPWRRPVGLRNHLERVIYDYERRVPPLAKELDMDALLADCNEKFGASYSVKF